MHIVKFKKAIFAVLFATALVGGGLVYAKTVDADLSKNQAVSIVQNSKTNPTSGKVKFETKFKLDHQTVVGKTQGEFNVKPELFHSLSSVKSGKYQANIEQWGDVTSKRLYTKQDGKWQYGALQDNEVPDKEIQKYSGTIKKLAKSLNGDAKKNAKLSHKNGIYTLKTNVKLSKASKLLNKIWQDNKVDTKELKKRLKISKCYLIFTIEKKKVTGINCSFKTNLDKKSPVSFKIKIFDFNKYDDLKLPDEVKNATPAPAN